MWMVIRLIKLKWKIVITFIMCILILGGQIWWQNGKKEYWQNVKENNLNLINHRKGGLLFYENDGKNVYIYAGICFDNRNKGRK